MSSKKGEYPTYSDFISKPQLQDLLLQAEPVSGIKNLKMLGTPDGLETPEALDFLVRLYEKLHGPLKNLLEQRVKDRKFIDDRLRVLNRINNAKKIPYHSKDYLTVLGLKDSSDRVVFGPLKENFLESDGPNVAPFPAIHKEPQVTLFGPPENAKMAINAMNAFHRRLPEEPALVEELLSRNTIRPRWGADLEDSKTPLHNDLVHAGSNLTACIEGKLSYTDPRTQKEYRLAEERRSMPIKRFPGLALPSTFLFYKDRPIPLHLYDFALHLFHNWNREEGLIFYVPKLENEEEAAYIHDMVALAEQEIRKLHSSYKPGTIRLMIVLENPRAILRFNEIMDKLRPYFLGASLGWHDYLASTARLFREDSRYKIPVKADPEIVIKHIKASHELVAQRVARRGGLAIGGMYGILPLDNKWFGPSFQITLRGYFKDVITQMKRQLHGFWVAHPDFVRFGMALITAWKDYEEGRSEILYRLVKDSLTPEYAEEIIRFIEADDVAGLNPGDPLYVRSLIVADLEESDFIRNNDPEEIRYNVFQSLQYITDWLRGNGCVALPTIIDGQAVRVMDDLATAERSRWEVWHEIRHGRFDLGDFLRIAREEFLFIKEDLSDSRKIVQVKWNEETAPWYPLAFRIMVKLMTDPDPVEFATQLLLPFTVDSNRNAEDPLAAMMSLDREKYRLTPRVERYLYYFEQCGSHDFVWKLSERPFLDLDKVKREIASFSIEQIREAASFHGDIGAPKKELDSKGSAEQSRVLEDSDEIQQSLREGGKEYLERFGFKYLVSAQGRSAVELLENLQKRLTNSQEEEIKNAREALAEITEKRILKDPPDLLQLEMQQGLAKQDLTGISIACMEEGCLQTLTEGSLSPGGDRITEESLFDMASLSKTVGTAFSLEFFRRRKIPLTAKVKDLLEELRSPVKLKSAGDPAWIDKLELHHLMSHSALNMHYVNPLDPDKVPQSVGDILSRPTDFGYDEVKVLHPPGTTFQYSGGGFMLLEHLVEMIGGDRIEKLTGEFLKELNLPDLRLSRESRKGDSRALGVFDDGSIVSKDPFWFPLFAAGSIATPKAMLGFLDHLGRAYNNQDGSGGISHDTAVQMLFGKDLGSREFMGLDMGLGVFIGEAGHNRFAIHQGANEGYRALFLSCFKGPDKGKGFVIFANGDNKAVPYISRLAQIILKEQHWKGIDFQQFGQDFRWDSISQEEIVNRGYKELLFQSFLPDLPEAIYEKGPEDPLAEYNLLCRARIIEVSDQSFSRAENLLSPRLPVFDPDLFGAQGKIMDSWETARHNPTGEEWLLLELPEAARVSYVGISTAYHLGNQVERISIEGRPQGDSPWKEVLPETSVQGHSFINLKLDRPTDPFRLFRIRTSPDGGLSRLGLYSSLPKEIEKTFLPLNSARWRSFPDSVPRVKKHPALPWDILPSGDSAGSKDIDLASAAEGAEILSVSNEAYGPARAVLSPFPPLHMFDGLETARSREKNHREELQIRLARKSPIGRIVLDFRYFKHNHPREMEIYGKKGDQWIPLVEKCNMKPYGGNQRAFIVDSKESFEIIRVITLPDGGFNRIHVYKSRGKTGKHHRRE